MKGKKCREKEKEKIRRRNRKLNNGALAPLVKGRTSTGVRRLRASLRWPIRKNTPEVKSPPPPSTTTVWRALRPGSRRTRAASRIILSSAEPFTGHQFIFFVYRLFFTASAALLRPSRPSRPSRLSSSGSHVPVAQLHAIFFLVHSIVVVVLFKRKMETRESAKKKRSVGNLQMFSDAVEGAERTRIR